MSATILSSAPMARRGPHAESCDHNKYPIRDVLATILRPSHALGDGASDAADDGSSAQQQQGRRVLELGAGTGEHALYFTSVFGKNELAVWQASDLAPELDGVRLNFEDAAVAPERCPPPIPLSFTDPPEAWTQVVATATGGGPYDVVFTANTFHIAPWEACLSCLQCLPLVTAPGGYFVIYGPFNYNGTYTSDSNRRFDQWLKVHKSPQSSIRDFEAVRDALAATFELHCDHQMPENNHCLVFRKR